MQHTVSEYLKDVTRFIDLQYKLLHSDLQCKIAHNGLHCKIACNSLQCKSSESRLPIRLSIAHKGAHLAA